MSQPSARRAPVRTQEERSAATRERLLDATIKCLVKYGYTGTTVTRIAATAKVTRGAQTHHFGGKDELVSAALTYLAERRRAEAESKLAAMKLSDDPVGDALDLLFELHTGPLFVASSELLMASRTDRRLRKHLGSVEPIVTTGLDHYVDAVLGGSADHALLRYAALTAMDAIRGLMAAAWTVDEAELHVRWARARERLRVMVLASLTEAVTGENFTAPPAVAAILMAARSTESAE